MGRRCGEGVWIYGRGEEGRVREIGEMRVRDGENGMGRYGKVKGE